MWSKEWTDNQEKYVKTVEELKDLPQAGQIFLHLGCGPKIFDKWINIDKFYDDPKVLKQDCYNPEFLEYSIDGIYSSHTLEHMPIRQARLALKNWFKILKPGGKLFLAIPDMEETMRIILDTSVPFYLRYTWFMYVLFGYQTSSSEIDPPLDVPVDPGQFHTCGFTEELIRFYLEDDGYIIKELCHYDGFDTPSMYIEAFKP